MSPRSGGVDRGWILPVAATCVGSLCLRWSRSAGRIDCRPLAAVINQFNRTRGPDEPPRCVIEPGRSTGLPSMAGTVAG